MFSDINSKAIIELSAAAWYGAEGMARNISEQISRLTLIIWLGSLNWITLPFLGLLMALAYFGWKGTTWGLLWIPYYALILFLGSRKLDRLQEGRFLLQAAEAFNEKEQREKQVSEDARAQRIEPLFRSKEFQKELEEACQAVGKIFPGEEWRLGLIVPGHDHVSKLELITPVRTAVLHPLTIFRTHSRRLAITEGYSLATHKITLKGEGTKRRCLKNEVFVQHSRTGERLPLPKMLHEEGFPVMQEKDGTFQIRDNIFVTVAGGIWVEDRATGEQRAVKTGTKDTPLFIQRILIDDEGKVIHLGFDDGDWVMPNFSVTLRPVTVTDSRFRIEFLKATYGKGYVPILWYHTSPVPFTSEFWIPILEIPLTSHAIPELVIDPQTKRGRLFIAKQDADLEECVQRLQHLWEEELTACDRSLLALTKDEDRLRDYLRRKEEILAKYFLWEEYDLRSLLGAAQPSAPQRRVQMPVGAKVAPSQHLEQVREKSYRDRLAELWKIAHSPEARKAAAQGGLLGALISLPWALIKMGNLLLAGYIVLTGLIVGDAFGSSSWLSRQGYWRAAVVMHRWGIVGLGLAMLAYYSLTGDTSRIWGLGIAGYVLGRYWGFRRWWWKEVGRVHYEAIRYGPVEEYYWEYPDPINPLNALFHIFPLPQCQFRIRYPEAWIARCQFNAPTKGDLTVRFLSPFDRGVEINIVAGSYTSVASQKEYFQELNETLPRMLAGAKLHLRNQIRLKKANIRAEEVVYTISIWVRPLPLKLPRKIKKIMFWRQGIQFFITLATPPRLFSKYEPIFDRCKEEFLFT